MDFFKKKIKGLFEKKIGVALFISILMTMSLAIIAMASMSRLSEVTHTTGKNLQERQLILYSQSAANIVNGEIQKIIDAQLDFADIYTIEGFGGEGTLRYYPRDISVNPGGNPTLFGYRATAKLFAREGFTPPGSTTPIPQNGACYDIVVDVREVYLLDSGNISSDVSSKTDVSKYYLGKAKTVGIISCFQKG
jgi:hypothetical protein